MLPTMFSLRAPSVIDLQITFVYCRFVTSHHLANLMSLVLSNWNWNSVHCAIRSNGNYPTSGDSMALMGDIVHWWRASNCCCLCHCVAPLSVLGVVMTANANYYRLCFPIHH